MRILAVSHTPIWPTRSGAAIRRLMILRGLAHHGAVDLLYVGDIKSGMASSPEDVPIGEVHTLPVRRRRPGLLRRATWLIHPRQPYEMIEWAGTASTSSLEHPYDLGWFFRPLARTLAGELPVAGVVVDLDDLESEKLRQKRAVRSGQLSRQLVEWRNGQAWERYQRRLSRMVDALTVSKFMDRSRLGVSNCFVVPNGFPEVQTVSRGGSANPVFLMVGLFTYEPNAHAAEYFVDSVFPSIRTKIPRAEVRLVGKPTERVQRLVRPGVTIVGEVEDLSGEYERAAAAVVPIRIQSGTRVKIIEAFARGVPVVSTPAGCAGLEVRNRVHLLVADEASVFADRCVELVEDRVLGGRLAERAYRLYREAYGQERVSIAVGEVVASVSQSSAGAPLL